MPTFTPPSKAMVPPILPETTGLARRLFRHFQARQRGQIVVRLVSGEILAPDEYPYDPNNTIIQDYWLGGHSYTIDAATATALTAAGYGAYIF